MAAHPGGGASHTPYWEPLTQAQQSGKDHEAEANAPEDDARNSSATCAADGEMRVGNVDGEADGNPDDTGPEPLSMCPINEHRRYLLSMIPGAIL